MATLSSLTGSNRTTGSTYKGIGGMVSGLDTDQLVKDMTITARAKIVKQQQSKQKLLWQQTSYRNISTQLINISQKYMSYTSKTNLGSRSFYEKTATVPSGPNSDKVTITGSSSSGNLVITGSESAKDAQYITNASGNKDLTTKPIDLGASALNGKELEVKIGEDSIKINLSGIKTTDELVTKLNTELAGKNITVTNKEGKLEIKNTGETKVELKGDSATMSALGLGGNVSIDKDGTLNAGRVTALTNAETLAGKQLNMTFNGVTKTIKMPTLEELNAGVGVDGKTQEQNLADSLQTSLDTAFGSGKVGVEFSEGALKFSVKDAKDTFKISSGSAELIGENGIFGIPAGSSNKINLSAKVSEAGFGNITSANIGNYIVEGKLNLEINGVKIEGLTADSTVKEVMDKINSSSAGVKVTYSETLNTFSMTAENQGASGKVEIGQGANNLAAAMFGNPVEEGSKYTAGTDAKLEFSINGQSSSLTSASNSFYIDGLTIAVKGDFTSTGVNDVNAIKVESKVETDKIYNAIVDMVNDYNSIIELVNKEATTKPNRNYPPLTDDQRAQMSESEIKAWEEKAQEGLLYGDSALVGMANELRHVFTGNGSKANELAEIGITVSSNWRDNGKIIIDEDKLKSAIENDTSKVQDLFAGSDGDPGIMNRMKTTMDKYAKTEGSPKGILIEKAGHPSSPLSTTSNRISEQLKTIDETVAKLQARLKAEESKYYRQFANLESVLSNLYAQSEWLYQQM